MEKDHVFHLNYAVTLHKSRGTRGGVASSSRRFDEAFAALDEEAKNADPEGADASGKAQGGARVEEGS